MSAAALECAFVPDPGWIANCARVELPGHRGLLGPRIERAAAFDLVARLVGNMAAHRPTGAAVLAALSELGRRLIAPDSALATRLRSGLAERTGLSVPLVEAGLERCARQLTAPELERTLREGVGDPAALDGFVASPGGKSRRCARPPELLVQILPGNVFAAGITALARALLLRGPVIFKSGRGDPVTVPALLHELHAIDSGVTAGAAAWWWAGGDAAVEEPLFASADVVVVHGSDATIERVRHAVAYPTRVVAYGPRVSATLLARGAVQGAALPLADALATDVALYDQAGCLSSCVVCVEGDVADAALVAEALAAALARAAARWPRAATGAAAAAPGVAALRTLTMSPGARHWSAADGGWHVVLAPEPAAVPLPGGRFVVVRPFADLDQVWTSPPDDWTARLQALAIAAPAPRDARLALAAARAGVPRICRVGELQSPPLDWPQDGRPALGDLVSWTAWEA